MAFEIEHNLLKKYREENGVTEVTVPDGVTVIGERAFEDCKHLTSVHLPDGVTKIAECAFFGCKTLTNVHIPDSITKINGSAFSGCKNLSSIDIPDSVKYVGYFAFSVCDKLKTIHLPENIAYIGEYAFSYCTEVFIPVSIPETGETVEIPLIPEQIPEDVPLMKQIQMLRTKKFSVSMKTETKYLLLCRFLVLCPEMPELVAYMKEHFAEIFAFAVENNQIEAILILIGWNLLNQGNIDDFIRLAIENTQKTGNPEIQLALTEYKYKHIKFTSIEDKFKL